MRRRVWRGEETMLVYKGGGTGCRGVGERGDGMMFDVGGEGVAVNDLRSVEGLEEGRRGSVVVVRITEVDVRLAGGFAFDASTGRQEEERSAWYALQRESEEKGKEDTYVFR
jgi:hypothetical protein